MPPGDSQVEQGGAAPLPGRCPAQRRGRALRAGGPILARRACPHAALAALRQRRRAWCATRAGVRRGCAPPLGGVRAWWRGAPPARAGDGTLLRDRVAVLAVRVR